MIEIFQTLLGKFVSGIEFQNKEMPKAIVSVSGNIIIHTVMCINILMFMYIKLI